MMWRGTWDSSTSAGASLRRLGARASRPMATPTLARAASPIELCLAELDELVAAPAVFAALVVDRGDAERHAKLS